MNYETVPRDLKVSIFSQHLLRHQATTIVHHTMDYLQMDEKRGHVTCGNQLAIERHKSFQKFASFEEELFLFLGMSGPYKISHGLIWGKNDSSSIK